MIGFDFPPERDVCTVRATTVPTENMSRVEIGKRPLRVLWVADSMKTAMEDAQMGAFMKAADRSRLSLDLLVLSPGVDRLFRTELEARGGSVNAANALSRADLGALFRVLRSVKEGRYDLIHAHTSWASLWGTLVGRLLRVPVVATLYDTRVDRSRNVDVRKEEQRAIRALRRWAARVIALSGAQWDRYIQEGAFSRAFLEVINQGVDADELPREEEAAACKIWLRGHAGFPAGGPIVATVADLDDWESGVDVLLWALPTIIKAHPQARFVVVGEGEHREELQRRVRVRGLNKLVSWHNSEDDIQRILLGSDLFIHPSLRDPFPIAALKAMAAGRPVVGTRVGGVPEIIGTAGRLVPRSNADALAQAVVELLEDPHRLSVMGQAASNRARNLFPVSGWVSRIERMYRDVLDEAGAGRTSRPKSYARLDVELLGLHRVGNGTALDEDPFGYRSPKSVRLPRQFTNVSPKRSCTRVLATRLSVCTRPACGARPPNLAGEVGWSLAYSFLGSRDRYSGRRSRP